MINGLVHDHLVVFTSYLLLAAAETAQEAIASKYGYPV